MTKDIFSVEYQSFLQTIKTRIGEAQLRAVVAVNKELIILYWYIGQAILKQQKEQGWGAKVIGNLSVDLHAAFPQMKGFSPRNLKYMRAFGEAYPDIAFVQTVSAQITWSHNIALLDKVKDHQERVWYMQQAIEYGWSLNILETQIETKLYHRKGKAITNFKNALPSLQSDLAIEVLKDPYIFDFITTNEENKERNLQEALIAHIRRFLLELGVGFTFIGSNYHLTVGGDDFYIDLLLYHIRLRCFVVIELKTGAFKPEYAGKMNFYLTAVNRQIKHPDDKPSIGIILCKTKNKATAEYALSDMQKPIGIANYTTSLPDALKAQLPDITELEKQLQEVEVKEKM